MTVDTRLNMQQIHIKCMYVIDIVHLVGIKKVSDGSHKFVLECSTLIS